MTSLLINLPDALAAKLAQVAKESGNVSIEEYVNAFLNDHIEIVSLGCPPGIVSEDDPNFEEEIERRIDNPGPSIPVTPQFWEDLKQRVRNRRG